MLEPRAVRLRVRVLVADGGAAMTRKSGSGGNASETPLSASSDASMVSKRQ